MIGKESQVTSLDLMSTPLSPISYTSPLTRAPPVLRTSVSSHTHCLRSRLRSLKTKLGFSSNCESAALSAIRMQSSGNLDLSLEWTSEDGEVRRGGGDLVLEIGWRNGDENRNRNMIADMC